MAFVFLASLGGTNLRAAEESLQPRAILEQWLEKANKLRSMEADFEQVRYLNSVGRPLRKPGQLWMEKPDLFRWQVGSPPALLAVREKGGSFVFVDSHDKTAKVWTRDALATQIAEGKEQGLSMMSRGFSGDIKEFEQHFELKGAKPLDQAGVYTLELRLKDRRATMFVLEVNMTVCVTDGSLRSFVIFMRDGSRYETNVRSYKLNANINDTLFKVDTSGYKVENMAAKK